MSEWFYALGEDRQGPVDAETLVAMFHRGELSFDTRVWTEGMPQWQTLREVAGLLGLDVASEPAPALVMQELASPYSAPLSSGSLHATPRQDGPVVYAGFWKRFAAAFIDSFILGAVSFAIIIVCMLMLGGAATLNAQGLASELAQGTIGIGAVLLIYVLPIVAQVIYFTWMHASASQATLGKMAVGIKVTRGNGEALMLGRSFGRWCAYFFLNLVTCGIGTLVSAFTSGLSERKQGLHDMMADTLVVDRWAFTPHPERQRRELGVVTWIFIVLAGLMAVGYVLMILFAFGMAAMGGANH